METTVPHALGPYARPLLGPVWAEFGLALILLLARGYTSWHITERVRLDLFLAIITFVLASTSLAFFTVGVVYGLGQHSHLLSLGQRMIAMRWSWCFTSVSLFAIAFGKLTVIAFLQQLHGPHNTYKAVFLWTLGFSNLIINAITVAIALTSCSPTAKLWDPRLPGSCNGVLRNEYCAFFQGSWNAMADLILAMYPITFLYGLKVPMYLKLGLCGLMGLGVIACACAIVKTVKLALLSKTDDSTYYVAQLNFWNATEMWVILIVACIPPIRKLLVDFMKKIGSAVGTHAGHAYPETYSHSGVELRTGGSRSHRGLPSKSRSHHHVRDNESEQDILGAENNIRKTTNIDIEYWPRPHSGKTMELQAHAI